MPLIKFRSKKSIQKRLRGRGLKHKRAYTSHLAYPAKRKNKETFLNHSDWERLRKVIYGGGLSSKKKKQRNFLKS